MGTSGIYKTARLVALDILDYKKVEGEKNGEQLLEEILDEVLVMPLFKELRRQDLRSYLEEDVNTYCPDPKILEDNPNHVPWLAERSRSIEWNFWDRYKRHLLGKMPASVVDSIDSVTDEILGRLEDPKDIDRRFLTKGMVVGQVQSGKTGNYTGLICKAVDAGYRIIIVLAGNHNSLRSQTQMRLDEEFLGYDTAYFKLGVGGFGVGSLPGSGNYKVISLTSRDEKGDFNKKTAKANVQLSGDPILLVVKKNALVLQTIIDYFVNSPIAMEDAYRKRKIIDKVPLLVIDDEADLASPNTADILTDENDQVSEENNPTKINGCIRSILSSFSMRAYVGYTATPFANIFIHPEADHKIYGPDLFPENFIVNLAPPSNYVGPAEVFGLDEDGRPPLPVVRYVDDQDCFVPKKHNKEFKPSEVPESLSTAMKCFLLSSAIRRVRGQEKCHNSMLVHGTRFTDVHSSMQELVEDELRSLKDRMRYGDGDFHPSLREELRELWETDYKRVSGEMGRLNQDEAWERIDAELTPATEKIQIKKINGTSSDVLDYRDNQAEGLSLIVIGGDKLSRGLTLEGLTISYYLRSTKFYDTLMQMGRWFGYRPGYDDLCRIFLTHELADWFQDITLASEELRKVFDYMQSRTPPLMPRDYGLRVRSHPVLMVTSRVKMRTSEEIDISYAQSLNQTRLIDMRPAIVKNNFDRTNAFLRKLGNSSPEEGWFVWRGVGGKEVADFLREFYTHAHSDRVKGIYIADYIRNQLERGELTNWTVGIRTIKDVEHCEQPYFKEIGGVNIIASQRAPLTLRGTKLDVKTLLSKGDEALDLTESQKNEARRRAGVERSMTESKSGESDKEGYHYRDIRPSTNGLLLIYPLDPVYLKHKVENPDERHKGGMSPDRDCCYDYPIIGIATSFPSSPTAVPIKYRVNLVYARQEGARTEQA